MSLFYIYLIVYFNFIFKFYFFNYFSFFKNSKNKINKPFLRFFLFFFLQFFDYFAKFFLLISYFFLFFKIKFFFNFFFLKYRLVMSLFGFFLSEKFKYYANPFKLSLTNLLSNFFLKKKKEHSLLFFRKLKSIRNFFLLNCFFNIKISGKIIFNFLLDRLHIFSLVTYKHSLSRSRLYFSIFKLSYNLSSNKSKVCFKIKQNLLNIFEFISSGVLFSYFFFLKKKNKINFYYKLLKKNSYFFGFFVFINKLSTNFKNYFSQYCGFSFSFFYKNYKYFIYFN